MGQGASGLAGPPSSDGLLLNIAAKEGHCDIATLFLSKNPALAFHTDSSQHTPVHYAAQSGNEDILQLLIRTLKASAASNTFDPVQRTLDLANSDGQTALMLACASGHEAVTKLLLSHGASVQPVDASGRTCLHYAARHGSSSKCMLIVLAAVAQAPQTGTRQQHHTSQTPADAKHAEVVRLINLPDKYGRTALHHAAWTGHVPGAHALLAAGATLTAQATVDCYEMDLPCNAGATPLHVAALKDNRDVALLLLNAYVKFTVDGGTGVDPRAVLDAYGMSPYAISAQRGVDKLKQLLNPRTVIAEMLDTLPLPAVDDTDQIAVALGRLSQAVDGARGFVRAMTASSKGPCQPEPAAKATPLQHAMRRLDAQDMSSRCSTSGTAASSRRTTAEAVEFLNSKTSTCKAHCCSHAEPTALHDAVPEAFLCPLTKQLLREPVVASDGFTFEKAALQQWLQDGNEASPVTKRLLPSLNYYPNNVLYILIEEWHSSRRHADQCTGCDGDTEPAAVAVQTAADSAAQQTTERGISQEGSPLLL